MKTPDMSGWKKKNWVGEAPQTQIASPRSCQPQPNPVNPTRGWRSTAEIVPLVIEDIVAAVERRRL